ncbi:MAG: transposase [Candidatus Acidiferrales bacterium]
MPLARHAARLPARQAQRSAGNSEKKFESRLGRLTYDRRAMPDSYVANRVHCVFSTKNRAKIIPVELQPRLWSFMAGIAKQNGIMPIAIGGFDDHAHVFIPLPQTMALAKAMQLIKAGSSKWCNQSFGRGPFEWQAGYSAVSVSMSMVERTKAYIRNQREHHRRRDFAEEWRLFLEKNGLAPEPGQE